jgi:predicted DNA-binding WGR domain protein
MAAKQKTPKAFANVVRRFEYKEGGRNEYWEIERQDARHVAVRWGRIGATPQQTKKEMRHYTEYSPPNRSQYERLVKEKLNEGYVEVSRAEHLSPDPLGRTTTTPRGRVMATKRKTKTPKAFARELVGTLGHAEAEEFLLERATETMLAYWVEAYAAVFDLKVTPKRAGEPPYRLQPRHGKGWVPVGRREVQERVLLFSQPAYGEPRPDDAAYLEAIFTAPAPVDYPSWMKVAKTAAQGRILFWAQSNEENALLRTPAFVALLDREGVPAWESIRSTGPAPHSFEPKEQGGVRRRRKEQVAKLTSADPVAGARLGEIYAQDDRLAGDWKKLLDKDGWR